MKNITYIKAILILMILLISGACSSVINEGESNNYSAYEYSLNFEKDDIDDGYSNEKYVVLQGDEDLKIDESGTYVLSGELNGSIIIDIDDKQDIKLILDGLTVNSKDFASIYIVNADKCTITLKDGSQNYLIDSDKYTLIDDNNVDAVIFSKADLVINGKGTLNINANYKHAIVSKDDLILIDGTYNINSVGTAIVGKDTLKIKDGTFNIKSENDALKSDNSEDKGRGYIYIAGGDINIDCGDDAIQAYNDLIIDGGIINITNCYEGLEASYITINGGDISIVSSDDGVNAANKNEDSNENSFMSSTNATVKINGGNIYINAEGDGIDSNGDVYIYGGNIIVEGPLSGGDAAFDYETGAYISNGEVLMIGQSSMAVGFNEDGSNECNLLYNLEKSYIAGTKITITNNEEIIFEFTAKKQFNSLLIASKKISINDTVEIIIGDDTYEYTFESISNINKGSNNMGIPSTNNMPMGDNRPDMDNSGQFSPKETNKTQKD